MSLHAIGCGRLDEPERVAAPTLSSAAPREPAALELPTLPPLPQRPELRGVETEAPQTLEASPRSTVKIEFLVFEASVDRDLILRLIRQIATRCQAHAPELSGSMTLRFSLTGNRAGPQTPHVWTTRGLGRHNACMRREMAEARWPTGNMCGWGHFEVRVRFGR